MSFKEVIGHTSAVQILQNALKEKRLGLTYLFFGPGGLGKSFLAKQFAKSLNCLAQDTDCCDSCPSCLRSDKLSHPDLHWLDLEGSSNNIRIEQIRTMQESLALRPFEGKAKVFIINNCQNLSEEAANCLLKVTEEPPADSVIILISTDLRLVLPTIASRAQKIKFSSLKRSQIEEVLKRAAGLEPGQIPYLAYYLDGRIGDALTLGKNNFLLERDAILNNFLQNPGQEKFVDFFKDKAKARQFLSILLSWYRDLLFVKVGAGRGRLIHQDKVALIAGAAQKYSYLQLISLVNNLSKSLGLLEHNINIRLVADTVWLNIQC